ncbi:hypothetical protein NE865_13575 [Phthorimaea operculella]|nr:hypothetical protein NE865_13575 [Phthorimaea operculella]
MEWLGYPAVQTYKGLDISDLALNQAWVFANTSVENIGVFSVRDDCFNCPYKIEKHLTPHQLEAWKVDVGHQVSWRITNGSPDDSMKLHRKKGWLCQMRPTFKEWGVYRLDIGRCQVIPEVQPIHTYFPLLLFCLTLLGIFTVYTSSLYLWRRRRQQKVIKEIQEKVEEKVEQTDEEVDEKPSTIDTYRGILLALIIFLTTGGGGYPLLNSDWGGLTIAECLFFAYIWSIGVRIPTVIEKAFKVQSKWAIVRDITVRTLFLILLGTAIDSTVEDQHSKLRLWCPLQKIGVAYFLTATAYLLTVQRFELKAKRLICKVLANIVSLLWCWIIAAFMLAILAIMISTCASFNCLSNLRIQDTRAEDVNITDEETQNCNNYISEYANWILMADFNKMLNVNSNYGFSRGAMGVTSAIIHMFIGLKSGVVYLNYPKHSDRLKLWTIWATLFGIGGVCFAGASLPINFNLWPIATILFVSTIATYTFGVVYIVVDYFRASSTLMSSLGTTSLVILCGHMLFSNTLPFMWGVQFNNHLLYLLQNLWIVMLWLIVAVLLKRRNVKFGM